MRRGKSRTLWVAVGVMVVMGSAMSRVAAQGQAAPVRVKIGVLTDMGGFFSDAAGKGSAVAAQMGADAAKRLFPELDVSVVSADHQNKADVGSSIARRWLDEEGVDAIIDLTNSAVGLAVQKLGADRGKVTMSAAGTSALTEEACSPTGVQWAMDSYTYSKAVTQAILQGGGKSWFFITVDYSGGHSLETAMGNFVKAAGGSVAGAVRHPSNIFDFSSYLIAAQASKAQVIGLANAGQDMVESIKQAHEFGLAQSGTILAAPVFYVTNIHALGLDVAQGVRFGGPFYWDMNDEARAWSKQFLALAGKMPTHVQAGSYTFVKHYLAAIHKAGTKDGKAVMAAMRDTPINDFMTENGRLRPNGSVVRQRMLLVVKKPSESKYAWDYAKIERTMSAEEAAPKSLAEAGCKLAGP